MCSSAHGWLRAYAQSEGPPTLLPALASFPSGCPMARSSMMKPLSKRRALPPPAFAPAASASSSGHALQIHVELVQKLALLGWGEVACGGLSSAEIPFP